MLKIVGIMPVYEEVDWIEYAIEGIIDFVDELIIAEGYQGPAWHFGTCRSKDGTIDVIKRLAEKYDKITLTQCQPQRHVLRGKAATHNHALRVSRQIKNADWYMICDADEFYSEKQKEEIRRVLESTKDNFLAVNARMFFYNFRWFIYQSLTRFIRVTNGFYFQPGQFPFYADETPYAKSDNSILLPDDPMFHYSFVKRTSQEVKRRIMEYCAVQRHKYVFDWINEVYLQWSPEKADEIYELNKVRFNGSGGIFFDEFRNAKPLQLYKGEHPDILDHHPFRHIDDVRKLEKQQNKVHDSIKIQHHISHYLMRTLQKASSFIRSF